MVDDPLESFCKIFLFPDLSFGVRRFLTDKIFCAAGKFFESFSSAVQIVGEFGQEGETLIGKFICGTDDGGAGERAEFFQTEQL
jgi:hypothetical protein